MGKPSPIPGRRRGFGRAVAEMHYRLRTEGDTPLRTAAAVWLGTLVGCLPVYGAHLVLCVGLAGLLRISRIKTYLAAHINNPLSAPGLLYVEFGVGHLLFQGVWPRLTMAEMRAIGMIGIGRDILVGSLVVGLILGALLAVAAYLVSRRARGCSLFDKLREETSRRYQDAGVFHWEFVRGKLKYDPLYRAMLASGLLPAEGRLIDLGCGRGILLALIEASASVHASGEWTDALPDPPTGLKLAGVELRESLARAARLATQETVPIAVEDLARHEPEPAEVYLLFDVLHYLQAAEQERLIRLIVRQMPRGGLLLIREPDSDAGLRFLSTRAGERLCAWFRLHWRQRFTYRSARAWRELLESCGLETRQSPLWAGTPYGNVLIEARKR